VILVSHDRRLLSKVANRVIELDNGKVRFYPGGYEDYLVMAQAGG